MTGPSDVERHTADRAERIAAGRVKHGVGPSENFPGNVCHLVSPIVGFLRLRERDSEPVPASDLDWLIDRLRLVIDMAYAEDEVAARPAVPEPDDREALSRVAALIAPRPGRRDETGDRLIPASLIRAALAGPVTTTLSPDGDVASDPAQDQRPAPEAHTERCSCSSCVPCVECASHNPRDRRTHGHLGPKFYPDLHRPEATR